MKIGIIEIRNLIKTVKETYEVDFTNYAMTAFRRRLELFLGQYNFYAFGDFLQALEQQPTVYEDFLYTLAVPDTEMFRDPGLWIKLKEKVLPRLENPKPTIWMAGSNTGEELASLLILLHETHWLSKTRVIASCFSNKRLQWMQTRKLDAKNTDAFKANYKRYAQRDNLQDYYRTEGNYLVMHADFYKNVDFRPLNVIKDELPGSVDMLMYRNQLLYVNRVMQHEILERLHKTLVPGSHIILGNKESIESYNIYNAFISVDAGEGIYKKPKTR